MTKTVYAHTPPGSDFPPFVNLSSQEDGTYTLTVRSQGNGGRDMGTIKMSPEAVEALTTAALDELFRETPAQAKSAPLDLPVIDPGPDSLEREIQAKANKAPRVTPAALQSEITHCYYINAGEAHRANWPDPAAADETHPSLDLLTICILVLRNGFTVHGVSACASPENFNAEIGRRIARENAEREIRPLLGFRLRDELARPVLTEADALADLAGEPRPS